MPLALAILMAKGRRPPCKDSMQRPDRLPVLAHVSFIGLGVMLSVGRASMPMERFDCFIRGVPPEFGSVPHKDIILPGGYCCAVGGCKTGGCKWTAGQPGVGPPLLLWQVSFIWIACAQNHVGGRFVAWSVRSRVDRRSSAECNDLVRKAHQPAASGPEPSV